MDGMHIPYTYIMAVSRVVQQCAVSTYGQREEAEPRYSRYPLPTGCSVAIAYCRQPDIYQASCSLAKCIVPCLCMRCLSCCRHWHCHQTGPAVTCAARQCQAASSLLAHTPTWCDATIRVQLLAPLMKVAPATGPAYTRQRCSCCSRNADSRPSRNTVQSCRRLHAM